MDSSEIKNIYRVAEKLSSDLDTSSTETAIILAAGHGKRIKSQTSKMLHKIWSVPTVLRVYNACRDGIKKVNTIIVVGIKAEDVMSVVGKQQRNLFAYQENQDGTGHAVQVALKQLGKNSTDGIVYVLPGDMGLIDVGTIRSFRKQFIRSYSDMMVLTGIYAGNAAENSYGRIIRVKEKDEQGIPSGKDYRKVIQIMENKDIHALPDSKPYKIKFNNRVYSYTKDELIRNNEFNSGVYAFRYKKLVELISLLKSNNIQNEIYVTDLIDLFNKRGYAVQAVSPENQHVVMGFNNKSVLKEMEAVARNNVYEKLKDIIEINDPDDFFIHESVVEDILKMDKKNIPLDITIGQGVHVGEGVKLNYRVHLKHDVYVTGNVIFGKDVTVWRTVHLSNYPGQKLHIGNNVEIFRGDILKGNIKIGDGSRIEANVKMTGSDEYPLRIGKNVIIKGASYLFGTKVGDNSEIEHSVLKMKKIKAGSAVRFYLPEVEGLDSITEI